MISKPKLNLKPIALAVALSVGALYGVAGYTTLDAGEVGVLVQQFGSNRGMQEQTYTAGTYWIDPVLYDVFSYDARSKQEEFAEVSAETKDGQPILIDVSFERSLIHDLVPQIHETVGKDYFDEVLEPAMRKTIRTATSSVDSSEIYTMEGRQSVSTLMDVNLKALFFDRGFIIKTNVRDIDFLNKAFVQQLEQKAIAAEKVIVEERNALAAIQTAIKVENLAEGEKQKRIKAAEAKAAEVTLAAKADKERMQLTGEGSKLQKEEEAKGLLAMKLAEAKGNKALAQALEGEGGERIVEIAWAENLGPNVKVYGFPTGAPGTTSVMDVNGFMDGITGKNVK